MTLLPELQSSVDTAGASGIAGLHRVILGPSPSGKTTQAHEYIAALQAKGIGISHVASINVADWSGWGDFQDLGHCLQKAKGGAILIEELDKATDEMLRAAVTQIVRTTAKNDTLVIVMGQPSLTSIYQMNTQLEERLNKPIVLTHKLTPDEREEFNMQKNAADNARRQKALASQQRVEEWRTARDEDLRPRSKLAAPKTARFRKPHVMT